MIGDRVKSKRDFGRHVPVRKRLGKDDEIIAVNRKMLLPGWKWFGGMRKSFPAVSKN
jgi:hypothetical protein